MIVEKCFSPDWITEQKNKGLSANRPIIEKSIRALALLGHLAETGLDFVFKGGTSLLLHLEPIRRLSIDIDILCGIPGEMLTGELEKISRLPPFTGFSEDERGERGLPRRRHFRFNYAPIEKGDPQPYILLDVVEENDCPLPLTSLPIQAGFIENNRDVWVKIPTVEGLLGDKLTAFAPNTIGVPFDSPSRVSQSLQVAKQMFDVGELFNAARNTAEVIQAYTGSAKKEASYRENQFGIEDSLSDTIGTCLSFCGQGLKNFPADENAAKLIQGCKSLQNHLVKCKFNPVMEAKSAAAKSACIAAIILADKNDLRIQDIRFDASRIGELMKKNLEGRYSALAKLRNANPESFYYWTLVQDVLGTGE
ncbi:MAG: nucleotidyl transferase AbiEii/AbiGii toxin family protein [Syntrophaceae bacterium]|nr:nucleotidyl transferase AbiEii/AbiGii toxin family protein [Syntrophaceae bacterium]